MKYEHRKLEELNLLDNFLFGSMVTHPEYGETFSRMLLQVILNRKLGKLTVIPQRVYYGSDTNLHGARLDVYLEEADEEQVTVYDVEPELKTGGDTVKSLPKRMRFYHAKMDSHSLKSGEEYEALKNVIVIMITPYDPFGQNRMLYTIKNSCVEEPDMPYEDGMRTLFLYTRGTVGVPSEEVKQLLAYMEKSSSENVTNAFLQKLHGIVEHVKHDEEVSVEYMRKMADERILLAEGRRIGREEGREEGRAEVLRAYVLDKIEENISKEQVLEKLVKRFGMSYEKAGELYEECAGETQ